MNWQLYNQRGPREQVIAAILADAKLGEPDKAYLRARIEALPAECFAVAVNGYLQTHEVGRDIVSNLNVTISGLR